MSCLLCFSAKPLSDDELTKGKHAKNLAPYKDNEEKFQISLCETPCKEPGCWCGTMLCCFCSQMVMRKKVLNHVNPNSGWDDYKCCQGFYGGCCCFEPGKCGEKACPVPCLCLEILCCPGPAASATSLVLRDKYKLGLDDDDVRLIRCNNCLFCVACVLSCLTICINNGDLDAGASCAQCLSNTVFACTSGCMMGQAKHEIDYREKKAAAPSGESMER